MQKEKQETKFPNFEEFKSLPDREGPYIFPISLPEINGHLRMLKMGSIAVSDGNMELSDKMAKQSGLRHFNDMPLVEMNFVLAGRIAQKNGHLPDELHFTKGYHNIMYNRGEWEQNRFIGGGVHNTFTINIHADRFAELFASHAAPLDKLVKKVMTDTPFVIEQPALCFTPYMHSIIHSFWNCPLTGSLKSLFMETKMMELMLLQWELFGRAGKQAGILKRKEDIEKMYLAKEILLRDIYNPPSLQQLARLCGTNEFKLKKGFKEVFNDTVFGYFNSVRLEQAKLLVQNTEKTITEIADETGYAHLQHFTRAFKKKFGLAPNELRR